MKGMHSRAVAMQSQKLVSLKGRVQRHSRSSTVQVNALFEKFTERSIKSVMLGQQSAKELGATEVSTEHILLGLISEENVSKNGYLNSGMTAERARMAVEEITGKRRPQASNETIIFSRGVRRTFEAATNECKRSGVTYISPEHILLALLSVPASDSVAVQVIQSLSIDIDILKSEANKRLKGDLELEPKKKAAATKEGPKMLDEYCKDLCAEVRAGKIDPVFGRSKEVTRVTQILARRSKNNPILLGEPGVGKTAIAEGLAHAIVHCANPDGSPLPTFLHDKRVMSLDVGLLIAGAKERGELESRMTKLISEIKESGNVILMIDEVHTLVGAGSVARGGGGGGGMDIANLIKPALARGEFQVIGATTVDEHRKYIEKDAALERRFQPVMVNEPSQPEAIEILKGLKEKYERHHKCLYTEEALEAAVKLSHKYIADRFMPDKAIDLMDEAGSRARITAYTARQNNSVPFQATQIRAKVLENPRLSEYLSVLDTKSEAIKDQLYEEAQILFQRERDFKAELSGPADTGSSLPVVDVADIEHIVSSWTGIPVERMGADEMERLVQLGSRMKEHVIGQNEAVETLASALMRSRCGLKDPNRPIASLLFVGPTGVGKTELAKVLADQYFGSRDSMIRLDMSEYMERHSVSKLIGAPPGYIGFGEGGKLTEAVRRKPCTLILLDEVEKAHPDVFSLLLQIMEDGRLTDSAGRVVSFKNVLLVLTSNIGSRLIASSGGRGLGAFMRSSEDEPMAEVSESANSQQAWEKQRQQQMNKVNSSESEGSESSRRSKARVNDLVLDEVKQFFRPEFLNRLDEQVVFQKLNRRDVSTIAGLLIEDTIKRVAEKGYALKLSQRFVERIMTEGYSDEYGARPMRQTVVRFIDDHLSDALLGGDIKPGSMLFMDIDPESGSISVNHSLEAVSHQSSSGFNGEIRVVQSKNNIVTGPNMQGMSAVVSDLINVTVDHE